MFSQNWYRVADLAPRLRGHVQIHDHVYRGIVWRIVEDPQAGRFHRLTPAAYFIVAMMDGRRRMREIWDLTEARFGAETPTQDDVIRLLAQLHAADLLLGQNLPDLAELDRRASDHAHKMLMSRVKNPMALRIPLFDADRFLATTLPLVGWLFTPLGAVLWLGLVIAGGVQAALHWPELTGNLSDRVLSTGNIAVLVLVYPMIKAVHELGHAYAVKKWGGEVHEIGLMFLVFLPVPYVDASASIAFRHWWQRAVVGGAGIAVELGLAAAAILIWVQTEPGLVRAALFNVALIGSVSTILFNGNPLLRFDGYYVMADLLGIPNLATRANKYLGYLVQRYGFGMEEAETPARARGERRWFVFYAIASFFYRISVMIAIGVFVASQFFVIGVVLALLVVWNMALWPLAKGLWFVVGHQATRRCRRRAVAVTAGAAAMMAALVFALPMPQATRAQGVVWLPEGAAVRTGTTGEVAELLARPGDRVAAGDPLLRLSDPRLDALLRVQQAHLTDLRTQFASAAVSDPPTARLIAAEVARAEDELGRMQDRRSALTVRAGRDGTWEVAGANDLIGQFLGRGDAVGTILSPNDRTVRVVVPEADIDLIRSGTRAVEVRLATDMGTVLGARILREVPAGDRVLPSLALSRQGGGRFALDPDSRDGPRALQQLFQFDLEIDAPGAHTLYAGARVHARFAHPDSPPATRLWRGVRQLFLRSFDV
ncbi:HlyD family secretion protein [Roseisalinus antarcticus]|uniref:HlyD family secretion protein n=2 Tax=Roseisalinus antarcticus TaxID=254357 RepID=A0A1Y5T5Y4_9RHOB|nr:HlyD family secretion protein [Roseisalinus antarcticus]